MKILQFGATGQLATELIRQAPAHPVQLTALSRAEQETYYQQQGNTRN